MPSQATANVHPNFKVISIAIARPLVIQMIDKWTPAEKYMGRETVNPQAYIDRKTFDPIEFYKSIPQQLRVDAYGERVGLGADHPHHGFCIFITHLPHGNLKANAVYSGQTKLTNFAKGNYRPFSIKNYSIEETTLESHTSEKLLQIAKAVTLAKYAELSGETEKDFSYLITDVAKAEKPSQDKAATSRKNTEGVTDCALEAWGAISQDVMYHALLHKCADEGFYNFLSDVVKFCLDKGVEFENISFGELPANFEDPEWGYHFKVDPPKEKTGVEPTPIFDKLFDFLANNAYRQPIPGKNKMGKCLNKIVGFFYDTDTRSMIPHAQVNAVLDAMVEENSFFEVPEETGIDTAAVGEPPVDFDASPADGALDAGKTEADAGKTEADADNAEVGFKRTYSVMSDPRGGSDASMPDTEHDNGLEGKPLSPEERAKVLNGSV